MTTSTMSVQVTNQLKNGDAIAVTAETFPAAALDTCARRLQADGTSFEQARDLVRASIGAVARVMRASDSHLERNERAYAAEQADDPPARTLRDQAAATATAHWIDVRDEIGRRFGESAVREYGLEGPVPTGDALPKQMANAAELLRAKPKSHTNKLGTFTTSGGADHLDDARAALSAALDTIKVEAKELHDALGRRDTAVTEWSEIYQASATLLEGYLRLGGRADLAERVRPTSRRANGIDATPDPVTPGPAEPAPPATPPSPTPAPTA